MYKFLLVSIFVLFSSLSSLSLSETLEDLVEQNGKFYKKFSETPFTGKVDGKVSSGHVIRGSFENGLQNGYWVIFYASGKLKTKSNYKLGVFHGLYESYWENGQLLMRGEYKNGLREGKHELYSLDGTKDNDLSGIFKKGKKISD